MTRHRKKEKLGEVSDESGFKLEEVCSNSCIWVQNRQMMVDRKLVWRWVEEKVTKGTWVWICSLGIFRKNRKRRYVQEEA